MSQLILPNSIDAGTEITAVEHQTNYTAIRDLINGNIEGGSGSDGNIKAKGITAREIETTLLMFAGMRGALLHEGVNGHSKLVVTPGAGLVLNYSAGIAFIKDDTGVVAQGAMIPVTIAAGSVTVPANASGQPRLDQVIVTMTGWNQGAVSVLPGTGTAGATLATRNGAAALPNNTIRLYDVLTTNGFAGPYTIHTNVRNRRWQANGRHYWFTPDDAPTLDVFTVVGGAYQAAPAHVIEGISVPVGMYLRVGFAFTANKGAGAAAGDHIDMQVVISEYNTPDAAESAATPIYPNSAQGAQAAAWRFDSNFGAGAPIIAQRFLSAPTATYVTAIAGAFGSGIVNGGISGAGDPGPTQANASMFAGQPLLLGPDTGEKRIALNYARGGAGGAITVKTLGLVVEEVPFFVPGDDG